MKKISKIGGAIAALLFALCNTCLADVAIIDPVDTENKVANEVATTQDSNILTYVIIGALIAVVVVCAVIVIKTIVSKKKEK